MSLLQEESSWVQSISNKITRHEAVIFMMEKTGMKPAPFLRVYSMIKFTVATPWVGSSKAFGMHVAQERLLREKVPIAYCHWFLCPLRKLRIRTNLLSSTSQLKFFIRYVQKPAIMSRLLAFCERSTEAEIQQSPREASQLTARSSKNIF